MEFVVNAFIIIGGFIKFFSTLGGIGFLIYLLIQDKRKLARRLSCMNCVNYDFCSVVDVDGRLSDHTCPYRITKKDKP